MNQFPATGNVSTYYYYDANGALNLSWDMEPNAATYFTYAPNGLVSSITPPSGATNAWTCAYDARLNRYYEKNGTGDATYFVWEGLKLLETRKVSGDTVTARNLHGTSPVPDIGTLTDVQIGTSLTSYAPIMDHRGTITALNTSGINAFTRPVRRLRHDPRQQRRHLAQRVWISDRLADG